MRRGRMQDGEAQASSRSNEVPMNVNGTVADILAQKGSAVWSISPDSTVFEALKVMAEKNVGALLVLSNGQILGLVSERDYARKIALAGRHSSETPVRDIISTHVVTVSPGTTIEECLKVLSAKRIRHLPVVDERGLVGVISIGDLVNWIINTQSATIDQLQNFISGQYPG